MNEKRLFYNVSTRVKNLISNAKNKAKKSRTRNRKDVPSETACNDCNTLAFTRTTENNLLNVMQENTNYNNSAASDLLREPGDGPHFILGEYCDFGELPHMGGSSPEKPTEEVYLNSSKESKKRNKKSSRTSAERNKMKLARMKGEGYTGYTRIRQGIKFVVKKSSDKREKRKMGPMCSSNMCKTSRIRKCKIFTQEDRKQIFEQFWDLPWEEKQIMVCDLVELSPTKQPTVTNKHPNNKSRRTWTLIYHLPKNNERYNVCKRFFLSTLGVNEWMAINWVKKHADSQKRETFE